MYYHIILTEKCNSRCKYCYEKSMNEFDNCLDKKFHFDFSAPPESKVDISKLSDFLKDEDTLIFYGGEPLVNFSKMKEIIDEIEKSGKKINFRMQTNGKLINEVPFEYLNKIGKILVSIDGTKERTDYNRGKGTYDKVIENIKSLREKGYEGELVARMTVSPELGGFYEQAEHIINLIEKGIFDSMHWQIDAGFYKTDFDLKIFSEFVKRYNEDIDDLIRFWIKYIKENKKVLKIYPFLGVFECIYYGKKTKLHCGSGYANYTITTDGKIVACPIMNNISDFCAGNINDDKKGLKEFYVGGKCESCEYLNICGGRCLYWNKANLWLPKGDELICKTIIHLIEKIKETIPEIKELIKEGVVSEKNFEYEKYFGPEIIP